ncbi:hypothetical protein ACSFXN_18165 [Planococcus sp. 1R117A]|uniref:hypothetical protein n=1 Tax=Planococcus sp. 1R117A TaxID=3447020 RepID=UPI003EDB7995
MHVSQGLFVNKAVNHDRIFVVVHGNFVIVTHRKGFYDEDLSEKTSFLLDNSKEGVEKFKGEKRKAGFLTGGKAVPLG